MSERRLTEADVEAIAEAMKGHTVCSMGLTNDEVTILKKLLSAFNKAAGIVGTIVLTAIVASLIAMLTKGFWVSLVSGVKAGQVVK